MNKRVVLALLSSPSVFSSIFLTVNSAKANEALPQARINVESATAVRRVCSHTRCVSSTQLAYIKTTPLREAVFEKPTEVAYTQPTIEYPMTEEESNAAIALYGCDCPGCVNALRQLRGQPPYL